MGWYNYTTDREEQIYFWNFGSSLSSPEWRFPTFFQNVTTIAIEKRKFKVKAKSIPSQERNNINYWNGRPGVCLRALVRVFTHQLFFKHLLSVQKIQLVIISVDAIRSPLSQLVREDAPGRSASCTNFFENYYAVPQDKLFYKKVI